MLLCLFNDHTQSQKIWFVKFRNIFITEFKRKKNNWKIAVKIVGLVYWLIRSQVMVFNVFNNSKKLSVVLLFGPDYRWVGAILKKIETTVLLFSIHLQWAALSRNRSMCLSDMPATSVYCMCKRAARQGGGWYHRSVHWTQTKDAPSLLPTLP